MSLAGRELEAAGQRLFTRMGLTCVGGLAQASLAELHSGGPYAQGEHAEFDYLIPVGDTCLIGEITARNKDHVRDKFRKFTRAVAATLTGFDSAKESSSRRNRFWQILGVATEDLGAFRSIRNIRSFMIMANIDEIASPIQHRENISLFYRYHWRLLQEYTECIGEFARFTFLDVFDVRDFQSEATQLVVQHDEMLRIPERYVTSVRDLRCEVITFLRDPYNLLPLARVYRRDLLPGKGIYNRYQRVLIKDKLQRIRDELLATPDFVFPNSILAVLAPESHYDPNTRTLTIPERYGALDIVDGQHRLFAYADDTIRGRVGNMAKLLVTGLLFEDASREQIEQFSARTFIEINTNQTRVQSAHLAGISYSLLGKRDPRAIAAHALTEVEKRKNRIHGLLQTVDAPEGKIRVMEIVGSLSGILNPNRIGQFQNATTKSKSNERTGYENLMGTQIHSLAVADELGKRAVICLEHYFNLLAKVFHRDWPAPGSTLNGSVFERAKMFAAWVKLLHQLIKDGENWSGVESELGSILDNVKQLRGVARYTSVLFLEEDSRIPDARARISDDFEFLKANRRRPTSIQEVQQESSSRKGLGVERSLESDT